MATARRKKTGRRRGASRGRKSSSAIAWFFTGLVIGLGFAAFLFFGGYLPDKPEAKPVPDATVQAEAEELIENSESIAGESDSQRYDFFTVLPEMEVVVPEQQLSRDADPREQPEQSNESYILQVASFQNGADAEQMKARLALRGHQASIQVVTVNDSTWHRVRIGPVTGARRADEVHRQLQDEGIPNLVMKVSP